MPRAPSTYTPLTILQRVNIEPRSLCWIWQLARASGYGLIKIQQRHRLAHRVSYEIFVGPIPDGLTLDHKCRNSVCVNPAHLEPVTMRENILRGTSFSAHNARKSHCVRGHELAGKNLCITATGERNCRQCRREYMAQRRSS